MLDLRSQNLQHTDLKTTNIVCVRRGIKASLTRKGSFSSPADWQSESRPSWLKRNLTGCLGLKSIPIRKKTKLQLPSATP